MLVQYGDIAERASKLMKFHGTNNPFLLARYLGVKVQYESMGTEEDCCKGFFLTKSRIKCITLNSDLDENCLRVVLSHELGHSVIHSHYLTVMEMLQEFIFFNEETLFECEANSFGAEVLMSDKDVFSLLHTYNNFFDIAAALRVMPEMLDYKFRNMRAKGLKVPATPIITRTNFWKKY